MKKNLALLTIAFALLFTSAAWATTTGTFYFRKADAGIWYTSPTQYYDSGCTPYHPQAQDCQRYKCLFIGPHEADGVSWKISNYMEYEWIYWRTRKNNVWGSWVMGGGPTTTDDGYTYQYTETAGWDGESIYGNVVQVMYKYNGFIYERVMYMPIAPVVE
ncbi:MAG: hypothetical protein JXR76_17450 [Deltaproteobacteria bacterium]|nr:hypothetical protein [Deltaproteobacteria bacterium]